MKIKLGLHAPGTAYMGGTNMRPCAQAESINNACTACVCMTVDDRAACLRLTFPGRWTRTHVSLNTVWANPSSHLAARNGEWDRYISLPVHCKLPQWVVHQVCARGEHTTPRGFSWHSKRWAFSGALLHYYSCPVFVHYQSLLINWISSKSDCHKN